MSDAHARVFAESAYEDSQRFDAMQTAEIDAEECARDLQRALALRHHPEFRADVQGAVDAMRAAREALANATRSYES